MKQKIKERVKQMGIFNFFGKWTVDNVELANQLFKTLYIGGNIGEKYEKIIKKIENENINLETGYPDRQKILLKVIELVGNPITSKQRYICAMAYAWSRVQYNNEAIYYLKLYLENELYTEAYKELNIIKLEERKKYHLYEMYKYLAEAYEKDKNLDEAMQCCLKELEYYEQFQVPYLDIANIYRKKNDLDNSIKILETAKATKYYKQDNDFAEVIDRYLNDYYEKKKNNYVYKPRMKIK